MKYAGLSLWAIRLASSWWTALSRQGVKNNCDMSAPSVPWLLPESLLKFWRKLAMQHHLEHNTRTGFQMPAGC